MNQTFKNPNEVKAIFPLRENEGLISKVSEFDITEYPEHNLILFKGPVWELSKVSSVLYGCVVG